MSLSSLSNAAVVDRLFATALDTDEYSQSTIYGHGMMNLNAATAAVAKLQAINGSNLLDDPNTSYYDLVDNKFNGMVVITGWSKSNIAKTKKIIEIARYGKQEYDKNKDYLYHNS